MITATERLGTYLECFAEFEKLAPGHDLQWLRKLREDAFARFCQSGFPTTHDEDWRFTNVGEIARTPFCLDREVPALTLSDLESCRTEGVGGQLVFVNGRFVRRLSSIDDLPPGVEVDNLAHMMEERPEALEPHFGRYIDFQRDAFCALNTAFAEDGAYVRVRRGTGGDAPIKLLFITAARESPTMWHPRNLIVMEQESQATIVEEYVSLGLGGEGRSSTFCNAVTELVAGEQAMISHYAIEREQTNAFKVSTLRIQQERNANVASHSLLFGGALVRNNVHPVLAGEGGECLINGLFAGNGRQHLDNYMLVEHISPHCLSRQFYNGILDGQSHGVFHGRIIVHKDAQKTDAKQTNRNLLLSDDAQIDTKPQLEIHADDVKCTHGATIGQIDDDALFYLRSRGIDAESARRLLLLAFANECTDRMKPGAARTYVQQLLERYLFQVPRAIAPRERTPDGERPWEGIA